MKFKFLVLAILVTPVAAGAPVLPSVPITAEPATVVSSPVNLCATANACGQFTPGVPEPSTWAMMVMGFAGLGGRLRASRRGLAAA
jgi:hypothetical protein